MPLLTDSAFTEDYSQDDIPANSASVRSATVDDAISNLLTPSIVRSIDLDMAEKRGRGLYRSYDKPAAESFMEANGLKGEFTFEDREYNQLELSVLATRKQKELKRQAILARADPALGPTAGRFGLSLVTSLMDPLTVATAFVPVVGQSRTAALLARAGSSAVARAGTRAGIGIVEGAVGAAAVEPIIYGAKAQEQADYDLSDSLLNIGLGGVLGGGLHAAGGALMDLGTASKRARIEARSAEIQKILAQRADLERPAPYTPLTEVDRLLRADEIEGSMEALYKGRRGELEQATAGRLSREQEVALRAEWDEARAYARQINDSVDPEGAAAADQRVEMITEQLRAHERAELAAGELQRLDSAWNRKGTAKERAEFLEGADGPMWRQLMAAEQADNLEAAQVRISKLESERADLEGVFKAAEKEKAAATGRFADVRREAPERAIRESHQRMRAIDAELRQLRALAGDLTEKLSTVSRVRVLQADPHARESALQTAVAQAVDGNPIDVEPFFSRPDAEVIRASVARQTNPDAKPLSDPAASRRADETLATGESDDLVYVEKQLQDAERDLKTLQREMGDEELPSDVREEIEAAALAADEAQELAKAADLLIACASRAA